MSGPSAGPIARLIQQLAKLPGVGQKTAARLAFHILRAPADDAEALAAAIVELRQRIRLCGLCWDFTETDPCGCARTPGGMPAWSVWSPSPRTWSRSSARPGTGGVTTSCTGCCRPWTAQGLKICGSRSWSVDVGAGRSKEVIVATNPSVEGEATAVYLAKLLRPLGVRASRIATGVPMGGELEYADRLTLARAIEGRREL